MCQPSYTVHTESRSGFSTVSPEALRVYTPGFAFSTAERSGGKTNSSPFSFVTVIPSLSAAVIVPNICCLSERSPSYVL
ncbi:MAG: hypothetical protein ACI4XA_01655 [Oscillospiraceae bacterium]